MPDIELLTADEIERLRHQAERGGWSSDITTLRLIATLETLQRERDEWREAREAIRIQRDQLLIEVGVLQRERDEARKLACEYFSDWLHLDDDPEDWERIIYRSGNPEWLRPIERFFESYPHVRRE